MLVGDNSTCEHLFVGDNSACEHMFVGDNSTCGQLCYLVITLHVDNCVSW